MGIDTAVTLDKVVKAVVATGKSHDAVVVTGDLSQDESKESYIRLAEILAPLGKPIYCLPGNHDQGDNMKAGILQADGTISECRSLLLGTWQVILLNTAERQRVDGHLSDAELSLLDNKLAKFPKHNHLVAMHHQPLPVGSAWMDRICLDNPDSLMAILARHTKVRAVIYGHVHQKFESEQNGTKFLSAPSTCVQFKPQSDYFAVDTAMPGFRWLKLNDDGNMETGVERIDQQDIGLDMSAKGY